MAIVFSCQCGRQLQAQEQFAGQKVKCPSCGEAILVPSVSAAEDRPEPRQESRNIADRPAGRSRSDDFDESDDRGGYPRRDRFGDEVRSLRSESGTSGKAITALVLSFFAFCGSLLFGVPAVVLAALSLGEIGRSQGRLRGKGLAITAILIACLGTVVMPVVAYFSLVAAIGKVRTAKSHVKSQLNLKQIGYAMADYDAQNGTLPPGAMLSSDGSTPLLSWRVAILPYVGGESLYAQFNLREPWDSSHNIKLLSQMPDVYRLPTDPSDTDRTHYRIFYDKDARQTPSQAIFARNRRISIGWLPAGASNTILVVEAAEAVPWTKPDELPFPVEDPIEPLLGSIYKNRYDVLFADGQVVTYEKGKGNDALLKSAITDKGADRLP
jgi:DNA-directed RNA polymerase subunit RPC12/RpoP